MELHKLFIVCNLTTGANNSPIYNGHITYAPSPDSITHYITIPLTHQQCQDILDTADTQIAEAVLDLPSRIFKKKEVSPKIS